MHNKKVTFINARIEELAKKWEAEQSEYPCDVSTDEGKMAIGAAAAVRLCAKELRELLI